MKLESVVLSEKDIEQVQFFQCSDEQGVGDYLIEEALMYDLASMTRTHLFYDEDRNLVGYYSIFNDQIRIGRDKQNKEAIHSPNKESFFPAIRIHYLGIDDRYRGNGYGESILFHALKQCHTISRKVGCKLITVEALSNSVNFYKKYDFVTLQRCRKFDVMMFKIDSLSELLR